MQRLTDIQKDLMIWWKGAQSSSRAHLNRKSKSCKWLSRMIKCSKRMSKPIARMLVQRQLKGIRLGTTIWSSMEGVSCLMALGHQSTKCLMKKTWKRVRASKSKSKASSIKLPIDMSKTQWLGCVGLKWNPMAEGQDQNHLTETNTKKMKLESSKSKKTRSLRWISSTSSVTCPARWTCKMDISAKIRKLKQKYWMMTVQTPKMRTVQTSM